MSKEDMVSRLKLNDSESILSLIEKAHYGKLNKSISEHQEFWTEIFNPPENLYPDEDFENHPFLNFLYYHFFEYCGCNTGVEGRFGLIFEILDSYKKYNEKLIGSKEMEAKLLSLWGTRQAGDLILDRLNHLHLLEHGGSNAYCWLSDDGMIVYLHLKEWVKERDIQVCLYKERIVRLKADQHLEGIKNIIQRKV